MKLSFAQIDAFTDRPFGGNPAAVIPLDRWLDDDILLAIAQENNLAETAFLVAEADPAADATEAADFELRWFTPADEVELCGHATLASGHFLLSADETKNRVVFRTRQSGLLEVARNGAGYKMSLPMRAVEHREMPGVLSALGIGRAAETYWNDRGYVMVVLDSEAAIRELDPDFRSLADQGPLVVIATAPGNETDFVSRVFVPAYGIDEDPVTGAAHAVASPYWASRLGRAELTAFQASRRGGRITCEVRGDRVILRGKCVTVIEGTFLLPDA